MLGVDLQCSRAKCCSSRCPILRVSADTQLRRASDLLACDAPKCIVRHWSHPANTDKCLRAAEAMMPLHKSIDVLSAMSCSKASAWPCKRVSWYTQRPCCQSLRCMSVLQSRLQTLSSAGHLVSWLSFPGRQARVTCSGCRHQLAAPVKGRVVAVPGTSRVRDTGCAAKPALQMAASHALQRGTCSSMGALDGLLRCTLPSVWCQRAQLTAF